MISLLTTHHTSIWLVAPQADGATITFRLEGQSYKSRAATYKVGTPWGKHQATSRTKSHCERFRTQVRNLGSEKTSNILRFCILISDFQSCVVFFPGDQLRIGIDTWGATIGGAFAQYQGRFGWFWEPRKLEASKIAKRFSGFTPSLAAEQKCIDLLLFFFGFCSIHIF